MEIVKIGNVELLESEAACYYQESKYIVTYSKIYQIKYSAAQARYYGSLIYTKSTRGGVGFAGRGRFYVMDAVEVNQIVGKDLVNIA